MKDKKKYNKLNSLLKDIPFDIDGLNDIKTDPSLLIDSGYEFVELGDYEQALKLFSMGITIDNSDPDILNGLGIALCELGMLDESKLIFERAARYNPEDAVTIANLAGVCFEIGENEKAIYYYNRALEINPMLDDIYYNLVTLYMESDSLYMAFLTCLDYLKEFSDNDEAKDLMNEIILYLGISSY